MPLSTALRHVNQLFVAGWVKRVGDPRDKRERCPAPTLCRRGLVPVSCRSLISLCRVDLDSNPVERSIRPLALNRKNALFAGSDEGGNNLAVIATLIENCKLSGKTRTSG